MLLLHCVGAHVGRTRHSRQSDVSSLQGNYQVNDPSLFDGVHSSCGAPSLCVAKHLLSTNNSHGWDVVQTDGWVPGQSSQRWMPMPARPSQQPQGTFVCYSGLLINATGRGLMQQEMEHGLLHGLLQVQQADNISVAFSLAEFGEVANKKVAEMVNALHGQPGFEQVI